MNLSANSQPPDNSDILGEQPPVVDTSHSAGEIVCASQPVPTPPAATETNAPSPPDFAEAKPESATLWLRRADQLLVGLLVTVTIVLFAIDYARLSGWGSKPVEILRLPETEYQYKLDVNQATWVEWALLDGIGEVLGKRIVEDREKNGPFRSVDDVLRVKGIGPKKMEQMRPWLEIRDVGNVAGRSSSEEKSP